MPATTPFDFTTGDTITAARLDTLTTSITELQTVTGCDGTNNMVVPGTFEAVGNATLGGTAAITGNVTLGGTLALTGAATLSSTAAIAGSVTIGGGYGSTGITLSDAGVIQANGAMTVDGAATLGSTLAVTGNVTVATNKVVITAASGKIASADKVTAVGGLGVGNSVPAETPGTCHKKLEIFASDGTTSLGFIAIYDAIT